MRALTATLAAFASATWRAAELSVTMPEVSQNRATSVCSLVRAVPVLGPHQLDLGEVAGELGLL